MITTNELFTIRIQDKMSRKTYVQKVWAENHEDAVRLAMKKIGERVGNPHHFVEAKGG